MSKVREAFNAAFETIISYAENSMFEVGEEGHSAVVEIMRAMKIEDSLIASHVLVALNTMLDEGHLVVGAPEDGVTVWKSDVAPDPDVPNEALRWNPPAKDFEHRMGDHAEATLEIPGMFWIGAPR